MRLLACILFVAGWLLLASGCAPIVGGALIVGCFLCLFCLNDRDDDRFPPAFRGVEIRCRDNRVTYVDAKGRRWRDVTEEDSLEEVKS